MKYFTIQELTESDEAKKRAIDNTPTESIKTRLEELGSLCLDSIRVAWGSGIKINSGYRCPKLNVACGGSATSAHTTGYAADMKPVNGMMGAFQRAVLKWAETHSFDQIIIEYPNVTGVAKWIHIGWKNNQGKQRKQILYTTNGVKYYNVQRGSKFYKV